MPRRRRRKKWSTRKRIALAILALPIAYFLAALLGSLIPVNMGWQEPDEGVTVYISNNGIHLDLVMPVEAEGLSWREDFPPQDFGDPRWTNAQWIMIGAGDKGIYTEAEEWADLKPGTAIRALTAGDRVMHVQWVTEPAQWTEAEIRLRPAEYRRLHAAVRSTFALEDGRPQRLDFEGYFPSDAFYEGLGGFNLFGTCNNWVAQRLRIAGVESSLWTPIAQGLPWRYRKPQPEPPVS